MTSYRFKTLAMLARLCALSVLAMAWAAPVGAVEGAVVRTDNVEARLVSERAGIAPGETAYVALHKIIRDGWHTYWRNAGDAGEPTRIEWELPPGYEAGEFVWPLPHTITIEGVITNYGYEGELILPVAVTAPASARPGSEARLVAHATWLVCEDICIPEQANLEITLPVIAGSIISDRDWGARIRDTVEAAPRPGDLEAGLERDGDQVRLSVAGDALAVSIADRRLRSPHFYPFSGEVIDHNAPQRADIADRGLTLGLTPSFALSSELMTVSGVLAFEERGDSGWIRRGIEVAAAPGIVSIFASGAVAPTAPVQGGGFLEGGGGLLGYIIGAFVGGLILNLMPCVFPVLSIKALGFVSRAHDHPGEVRRHGLLYLGGVLVTFLALAGVLLVARAVIGVEIGWGFHLQSPFVVTLLALVVFAIGLNFLGVFEIGGSLQGAGAGLAERPGATGAFFTGVLAVVVAAPCTAPFMGVAMGYALAQSAVVTVIIFIALALGLAAPFVALSFAPGLLNMLPKPGPWMDRLKQFFAFPMFLTAVWLVWVLASGASGPTGVFVALAVMTMFGFVVWVFNTGAGARGLAARAARAASLALLAGALAAAFFAGGPTTAAAHTETVAESAWSPARVAELRAEGRGVFVDFTATWCITCQFNKRVALTRPSVIAAFEANNVAFLTADWTNRDAEIAIQLAAFGRSGVPLYVAYPAEGDPVILPQLLSETIVINAIERIAE